VKGGEKGMGWRERDGMRSGGKKGAKNE